MAKSIFILSPIHCTLVEKEDSCGSLIKTEAVSPGGIGVIREGEKIYYSQAACCISRVREGHP